MARIIKSVTQNGTNVPIGVDGENVILNTSNNKITSAQAMFDEWEDFRTNAHFIRYSNTAPQSEQTKIWYKTN